MSNDAEDVVPFGQGGSELVALPDSAHRLLLDDVMRGLADIAAGRSEGADTALTRLRLQQRLAHKPQSRRCWLTVLRYDHS